MKRILLIDDQREPGWIVNPDADWDSGPFEPKYKSEDVEVSRTGELGIEKLKEQKYDLLLLDHDLGSGKDGNDVLNFLIDHPEHLPEKIYLVTANIIAGPKMVEKLKDLKKEGKIKEHRWIR